MIHFDVRAFWPGNVCGIRNTYPETFCSMQRKRIFHPDSICIIGVTKQCQPPAIPTHDNISSVFILFFIMQVSICLYKYHQDLEIYKRCALRVSFWKAGYVYACNIFIEMAHTICLLPFYNQSTITKPMFPKQ